MNDLQEDSWHVWDNWPFLGSFSTWLTGQRMEEVTRKQAIVWSRREGLMSIPPHKAAKENTRNTEQHPKKCKNRLDHMHIFCGSIKREGQAESKRWSGMFPSRSMAMQAVAGHGGYLWSFRPSRWRRCFHQQFHQVGFWLCVQTIKHEL